MALRELTGTALAVLATCRSVLAKRSARQLYRNSTPRLAVLIGALIGAVILQGNPGTIAGATVLGWFGIMFAQPFSLSTREFNGLAPHGRTRRSRGSRLTPHIMRRFHPMRFT